jgi:hypothetical protein
MKKIFFIFFIFGNEFLYAQEVELQGRYSASFLGSESINFVGKDSFYFDGFYCVNGVEGKGVCEIHNNYLYLNFENNKNQKRLDSLSIDKIVKTESNESFSFLQIYCLDVNGTPIPSRSVEIKVKGETRMGASTNTSGVAEFKIKKSLFPIELYISGQGFIDKKITLLEPTSYLIKLLSSSKKMIELLDKGEKLIYEINELTEDVITMRPQNSTGRFNKYKKVLKN